MGVASSPVTLAARWWWCMAWPNVVGMGSAAIALAASRRDSNIVVVVVVVPATGIRVCALHLPFDYLTIRQPFKHSVSLHSSRTHLRWHRLTISKPKSEPKPLSEESRC
jgi:hypothetical protein